jgi:hypothetical protein
MNTLTAVMLILVGAAAIHAGINDLMHLYVPLTAMAPSCRPSPNDGSSEVMIAAADEELPDWVVGDLARAVDAIEAGEPARARALAERARDGITPEWRLYR